MTQEAFLNFFKYLPSGTFGRAYGWVFPSLESLHFVGLIIFFGSLLIVDLRMLGYPKAIPLKSTLAFLPWAFFGFGIQVVTGFWFFTIDPFRYFPNLSFRLKMMLIVLAGMNALWFWLTEHDRVKAGDEHIDPTMKVMAVLSIVLWLGVITFGRLIPYLE